MTTDGSEARELRIAREVDAPRALVWAALTDPAHLARWWGPSGFVTKTHVHELRPGGSWRLTMHGPDGRAYANHAIFEEVEAPHRLAFRYVAEEGTEPTLHTTTVTLDELGPRRTRITLVMRFPTAEARAVAVERYGAVEGGHQTLGRLTDLLGALQGKGAGSEALVVRRVVPAPREVVWSAWTNAADLNRWFRTEAWSIARSALDLRVGGTFFFATAGPTSPETCALWRFTAIDAPRRLDFLQSFADADGAVVPSPSGGPWPVCLATTVTLEPHAGIGRGTLVAVTVTPAGASDAEVAAFRAAFPQMEKAWGEVLEGLGRFVAT